MIQRKRLGGACFAGATHFPDRFPKVVWAFAIVAATAGRTQRASSVAVRAIAGASAD